jgi:para-aminobenzoate synthetase/4-amino-4-deoxychorismate lyase
MHINEILNPVINNPGSGFFFTPPYYQNGFSYFFYDPYEIKTAVNEEQLFSLLTRIDRILKISPGVSAFGFLTYEAGYAFEKKLNKFLSSENDQLAYFSFYKEENVKKIHSSEIDISFEFQNDFNISSFQVDTSFSEYQKAVEKIKCFISEGDTYQVNYTIKGKFNFKGSTAALFKQIIFNQSAEYTALLNTENNLIISVSPELFFEIKERKRTMCGLRRNRFQLIRI